MPRKPHQQSDESCDVSVHLSAAGGAEQERQEQEQQQEQERHLLCALVVAVSVPFVNVLWRDVLQDQQQRLLEESTAGILTYLALVNLAHRRAHACVA